MLSIIHPEKFWVFIVTLCGFFFHYGYQIERKKFGFSFSVNWTSAFSQLQIEEPVFKIDIVDKGFSILKTLMYRYTGLF